MPIYEYRCRNGHSFEVMQSMSDDSLSECTVCQAPVQRVFHPVAVHFKGKGFYTTDYGRAAASDGKPEGGDKSADKPDSKKPDSAASGDRAAKDAPTKPAAKE